MALPFIYKFWDYIPWDLNWRATTGNLFTWAYSTKPSDVLLAWVVSANITIPAPSGWTDLTSATNGTLKLSLYWKRETTFTETNQNIFAVTGTALSMGGILPIRGAKETGNPFEIVGPQTGTGTSITASGGTTTGPEQQIISIIGTARDANTTGTNLSAVSNGTLTRVHKYADYTQSLSTGGGVGIVTAEKETAGPFDPTTITQATAVAWAALTVAVLPEDNPKPRIVCGPIGGSLSQYAGSVALSTPLTPDLSDHNYYGGSWQDWKENDLMLCGIETQDEAVTVTNFDEAPGSPQSNSTGDCGPTRMSVFWKRFEVADTSIEISDSGNRQISYTAIYRGVITTGDPFNTSSGGSAGQITNTQPSYTDLFIPGATTTVDDCCIAMFIAGARKFLGFNSTEHTPWTNADLSDMQFPNENGNSHYGPDTSGSYPGGTIDHNLGLKEAAGSYGNTTVRGRQGPSGTTSVPTVSWTGAIMPQVPSGDDGPVNRGEGFFSAIP